jgi:pimeloyl-ACP methyl ester carboxylesterase
MAGRGEEVASFEAYSRPLLDALPECEKAVLVAHSFGGQSLALATERHRRKSPRCRVRQGHHARRKEDHGVRVQAGTAYVVLVWNPGTEVTVLPGADHVPMFSKPTELAELLRRSVASDCVFVLVKLVAINSEFFSTYVTRFLPTSTLAFKIS